MDARYSRYDCPALRTLGALSRRNPLEAQLARLSCTPRAAQPLVHTSRVSSLADETSAETQVVSRCPEISLAVATTLGALRAYGHVVAFPLSSVQPRNASQREH
ncbi:hypothetical protein AcW2_005719 [Taiwanofungus camphoratus]|nr:hypothetical protein AcW2_005719 [Antrodia cinnamomea]